MKKLIITVDGPAASGKGTISKHIKKKFPQLVISIDTFRSEIAEACLIEGADIINDISSGIMDKEMMKTI